MTIYSHWECKEFTGYNRKFFPTKKAQEARIRKAEAEGLKVLALNAHTINPTSEAVAGLLNDHCGGNAIEDIYLKAIELEELSEENEKKEEEYAREDTNQKE